MVSTSGCGPLSTSSSLVSRPMTYYEYEPPEGWHESIFMGVEIKGEARGQYPELRCALCKEPIDKFSYVCNNEGCRTIISMMETEEYRIKG